MGRLIARMAHFGAAIVLVGHSYVLADESASSTCKVEPVVSATSKVEVESISAKAAELAPIVVHRKLFQHATYPAAWRAAQKSNRPILVFVSMPNCHYCEKMKAQVYRLPHVKDMVSNSFETVKAGRYSHAKLVEKLHIKWYPTTVLVGPNNKILDVIEGYADANMFQQRLHTGLASLSKPAAETIVR